MLIHLQPCRDISLDQTVSGWTATEADFKHLASGTRFMQLTSGKYVNLAVSLVEPKPKLVTELDALKSM